jgi:hypothetical protein
MPPDGPALTSAPGISPTPPVAQPGPIEDPTPSILLPRQTTYSSVQKADANAPRDRVSLAAFVLALFGGIGIAHVLGYLGLKRTANGRQRGRELALSALVIATVWLLGLGTVGAITLKTHRGKVPATSLASGNCIDDDTQGAVSLVKVVNCTTPHNAEVVGIFTLDDGEFPGNEALVDQAGQRCPDYVPENVDPQLAIYYLVPTTETWPEGDRNIICLVVSTDAPLTAPLE